MSRTPSIHVHRPGPSSGQAQRRAIVVAIMVLLVFVFLTTVVRIGGAEGLDLWGHKLALTLRSPATVAWALAVTNGGNHWTAFAVTSAAALFVAMASPPRGWRAAAVLVVGVWTTIGVRLVVADVVGRLRPPAGDWDGAAAGFAFPSGHTTAGTVSAAVVAWSLCLRVDRGATRRAIWAVAVLCATGVGWSRVWLGVHWPTDVAGAWCLGALGALLTCLAAQRELSNRLLETANGKTVKTSPTANRS